jgi:hypothetical protein
MYATEKIQKGVAIIDIAIAIFLTALVGAIATAIPPMISKDQMLWTGGAFMFGVMMALRVDIDMNRGYQTYSDKFDAAAFKVFFLTISLGAVMVFMKAIAIKIFIL